MCVGPLSELIDAIRGCPIGSISVGAAFAPVLREAFVLALAVGPFSTQVWVVLTPLLLPSRASPSVSKSVLEKTTCFDSCFCEAPYLAVVWWVAKPVPGARSMCSLLGV